MTSVPATAWFDDGMSRGGGVRLRARATSLDAGAGGRGRRGRGRVGVGVKVGVEGGAKAFCAGGVGDGPAWSDEEVRRRAWRQWVCLRAGMPGYSRIPG